MRIDDFYRRPGTMPLVSDEVPPYFHRLWDPLPDPRPGFFTIPGPIHIFGWATSSDYEDDRRVERQMWRRDKAFFSVCFSQPYPDPELGFQWLSEVNPITEAEFHAALELCGLEL